MKSLRFLLVLLVVLAQIGCAGPKGAIKLYEGSDLDQGQVVTLLPPKNISMVLYVSERTAGGSCITNCMFVSPVQVAPGKHRFRTVNMHASSSGIENDKQAVPPESRQVFALNQVGTSLLTSGFTFDFEQSLERGKTYVLSFGYKEREGGRRDYFVWWKNVSPQR